MSLSPAEIRLVVEELRPFVGAVVQKVYAPRERVVVLELRVPGQSVLLLVSVEAARARLHVVSSRPPSPEEALPFQQQARAHLVGRALIELGQPAPRRLALRFRDREGERVLEVELSGRHGNLVLTSAQGTIIATSGPAWPAGRSLLPGRPYVPPEEVGSTSSDSRFSAGEHFALSAAIEREYAERDRKATIEARRIQLERPLRQKRDRLRRTVAKVRAEADRTAVAESHRVAGELLKVNQHLVKRGATEARLIDYSSGEAQEVTVALKPELSVADNLSSHFRQYRRLSEGSRRAAARLGELEAELTEVEQRLAEIPTLTIEALEQASSQQRPPTTPARAQEASRLPYKEFLGTADRRIRVGKGARENDALTFKHGRPHDLWLHARGVPGSHVIVPLERAEVPPPELLLDACALAVHFSSAKGQDRVEVSYVPLRYVRKVKGTPGAVTYSQEKTLRFAHEPARIARLLASRTD
jgi:predicted ribosome quality control (RQC) complex YloA/Tae2 family protein